MCQRRAVEWHHHVPRDRRAHDHGVRCAGTICDELKVVDPPVQRQIVLEMDNLTPEAYRHLLWISEAGRQVSESPKKKVKMSTVIDQQHETEVPTLSRSEVNIYGQDHIGTAGEELLQGAAPSPEKIAAMEENIVNRDSFRSEDAMHGSPCHPVRASTSSRNT